EFLRGAEIHGVFGRCAERFHRYVEGCRVGFTYSYIAAENNGSEVFYPSKSFAGQLCQAGRNIGEKSCDKAGIHDLRSHLQAFGTELTRGFESTSDLGEFAIADPGPQRELLPPPLITNVPGF